MYLCKKQVLTLSPFLRGWEKIVKQAEKSITWLNWHTKEQSGESMPPTLKRYHVNSSKVNSSTVKSSTVKSSTACYKVNSSTISILSQFVY